MFNKILIANRGEIACRIIKTARRLGIETVAVYSTKDANCPHVLLADSAYCIGPPAALNSYLNIDAIMQAARLSGAEAIHPGYGFLSENSAFAQACFENQITFIGPPIRALEIMGSKQLAKRLLEKTNVPLTPGYHGQDQSDEMLFQQAKQIGFPVLIKAANGGGGKGMRTVLKEETFFQALAGARREALSSFANDTMLIEKLIEHPRHIEVQIMADNHGQVVHLFERDCSIQRRHQKIIEEAPASTLSSKLREQLSNAAVTVAQAVNYRGAGTIEFLVSNEQFYFMEMNTRLQVEHPVTEMVTGFDLVEWQILIAANHPLPVTQADIRHQGHAIECRIYAEDPRHEFLPSIGQLHFLKEPTGPGVRMDSGVTIHSQITSYYDPMIAKLITYGENRAIALQRLQHALDHYHIGGVKTNIPFLKAIIKHPDFINETYSTDFLNHTTIVMPEPDKYKAALMAACVDYIKAQCHLDALGKETFAWQMMGQAQWESSYLIQDERIDVNVFPISPNQITVNIKQHPLSNDVTDALNAKNDLTDTQKDISKKHLFQISMMDDTLHIDDGQQTFQTLFEQMDDDIIFYTKLGPIHLKRFNWQAIETSVNDHQLTAPMPATIVAIMKTVGDSVKRGEELIVLEAMKMEHTICSPHDGVLEEIFYALGAQVPDGAQLAAIKKIETTS